MDCPEQFKENEAPRYGDVNDPGYQERIDVVSGEFASKFGHRLNETGARIRAIAVEGALGRIQDELGWHQQRGEPISEERE